jgi:hypothetical protein
VHGRSHGATSQPSGHHRTAQTSDGGRSMVRAPMMTGEPASARRGERGRRRRPGAAASRGSAAPGTVRIGDPVDHRSCRRPPSATSDTAETSATRSSRFPCASCTRASTGTYRPARDGSMLLVSGSETDRGHRGERLGRRPSIAPRPTVETNDRKRADGRRHLRSRHVHGEFALRSRTRHQRVTSPRYAPSSSSAIGGCCRQTTTRLSGGVTAGSGQAVSRPTGPTPRTRSASR